MYADPATVAREFEAGRARAQVAGVVAGVADPPGPEELKAMVDEVLRGIAGSDFADVLFRAAAFARVVATGRARSSTSTEAGEVRRMLALAEQLEAAGHAELRAPAGLIHRLRLVLGVCRAAAAPGPNIKPLRAATRREALPVRHTHLPSARDVVRPRARLSPPSRLAGLRARASPPRDLSATPPRPTAARPGEVVWAWVPYEENDGRGKDRPVLLLQGRREAAWLGLMLTSKDHDRDAAEEARAGRHWMDVGTGGWDREGRPSEVRLDRVLVLDEAAIRREGAALDRAMFDRVVAAARQLHALDRDQAATGEGSSTRFGRGRAGSGELPSAVAAQANVRRCGVPPSATGPGPTGRPTPRCGAPRPTGGCPAVRSPAPSPTRARRTAGRSRR